MVTLSWRLFFKQFVPEGEALEIKELVLKFFYLEFFEGRFKYRAMSDLFINETVLSN